MTMFEANDYIGGHTHTVDVELGRATLRGGHRLHRLQRLDLPELHPAARAARRRLAADA
ncbi:MAG: hypothetical protein MZW92_81560 [Comamonadaceae bacterium]|nr:hypothetical protein [Comamonadaceae bacterium]